jgi:DNA polymerase
MPAARKTLAALAELRAAAADCRECPLGALATQTVWGEGPAPAPLMLVGEQPGDREDLAGHPFVGPAGQLLDRAIAALGWSRDQLYVTNAVKHFKYELRGKRRMHKSPGQLEMLACHHWLESEIALVAPAAIVALGASAARSLMGRVVKVLSERGQWLVRPDGRRVLVTLHPSALLRGEPSEREQAFEAWVADLAHASDAIAGGAAPARKRTIVTIDEAVAPPRNPSHAARPRGPGPLR